MNILLVKTDTIRFGKCQDKEISFGACDIAGMLFSAFARLYKQHNFYIIGSNDISKCDNLPNNLIDIDTPIKEYFKANKETYNNVKYKAAIDYCINNNIVFDKTIVWYGPSVPIVLHDEGFLSNKGTPLKLLESAKALGVGLAVATYFKLPSYYIINDPRQINTLPRDIIPATKIISQMNSVDKSKAYINKADQEIRETPIEYRPIEKLWLMSKVKKDWRNFDKHTQLIFTVNGDIHKLKYLQKWLFPYNNEAIVYGRWTNSKDLADKIEEYGLIDRFKNVPMTKMEDKMFDTRYTLVIPPSHKFNKFVSQKVYSMIYYGIIPFWCKYDYDSDNLYNELPDYIKISSPEEFYYKINELDHNNVLYNNIKQQLYSCLEDYLFTDEFVKKIFNDILE